MTGLGSEKDLKLRCPIHLGMDDVLAASSVLCCAHSLLLVSALSHALLLETECVTCSG
jgi:hypothetical protein